MERHKPELLAPAGNWASLRAAVENGADSVYFGVKGINMRQMASNFDLLELKKIMAYLREHNKKGYLALNIILENQEFDKVRKILEEARDAGVDAVILWDMGVFALAKEMGLNIHLSTQASVSNSGAVRFFAQAGVKRIVLARECTLDEIREIARAVKAEGIACSIECFIHGAMCISISGRCFLSSFSYGKSANRGECLQPCRREYQIKDTSAGSEYILGEDYVLSPKDLCAIEFIDELIDAGIHSFKIEGRMRSADYVKVVTGAYRQAIDACFEGKLDKDLKSRLKEQLATVYNRGFSHGYYFGPPSEAWSKGLEHTREKVYLGEVVRFFSKLSVAEIRVRNGPLKVGQEILFIGKHTPALNCLVEHLQINHQSVVEAQKGQAVAIKLPFEVRPKDKVFLWQEVARANQDSAQ